MTKIIYIKGKKLSD